MSNGHVGRGGDHRLLSLNGPRLHCFAAKRICAEGSCDTLLSIYNGTAFCSVHEGIGKSYRRRPA
jgi:hypothetical protein